MPLTSEYPVKKTNKLWTIAYVREWDRDRGRKRTVGWFSQAGKYLKSKFFFIRSYSVSARNEQQALTHTRRKKNSTEGTFLLIGFHVKGFHYCFFQTSEATKPSLANKQKNNDTFFSAIERIEQALILRARLSSYHDNYSNIIND